MRYIISIFTTCLLFLFSCGLKDDLEKVVMSDHLYDVAVPVASARVSISDFIQINDSTSEFLNIDEDNFITIVYSDELFNMSGEEYIVLPDFNANETFSLEALEIPDISTSFGLSLGSMIPSLPNGTPFPGFGPAAPGSFPVSYSSSFNSVSLSDGSISLKVENGFPADITSLQIELNNVGNPTSIASFSFPLIPQNTSNTQTSSLAGKTLTNDMEFNIVNIECSNSGIPIDTSDQLTITFSTTGLKASSGSGLLGDIAIFDTTITTEYSFSNSERIDKIRFGSGSLDYNLSLDFKEDVSILLSAPYLTKNGSPLSIPINVDYSTGQSLPNIKTGNVDLTDYEMDMSCGGITKNAISFSYSATIDSSGQTTTFSNTDEFAFSLDIRNVSIEYVEGYLGQFQFEVEKDTMDLGFNANMFGAEVYFEEPSIALNIENSFGIPIRIILSEKTAVNTNDNEQLILSGSAVDDSIMLNYPSLSQVGQYVETNIVLDNNTSNLSDLLAMMPNQFIFEMDAKSNSSGDTNDINFLLDTSAFKVDLELSIPFYGRISNLVLQDTVDFEMVDFDEAEYAIFHLVTENSFPADIGLQLYFLDESYTVLDSLIEPYTELFKSSVVDNNGDVISNTTEYLKIQVTKEKLYGLTDATKLLIKASLETYNNGNTLVKIYSDYEFAVNLGVQMNIKLSP